jgi:hypothetical protein
MSDPSDIDALSPIAGIGYETTFEGMNWVLNQLSTPTSNDDAESRNTHPSNDSIIRHCTQKWIYQPNCCGNDASPSRPSNLNRHIPARKTLNQLSPHVQLWKEVPSMQKTRRTSYGGPSSSTADDDSETQSTPSLNPPPPPTAINQMNYESELRCEFEFVDCHLSFHPTQIEPYISHTDSHFLGHLPPRKTTCISCDRIFEDPNEPVANWTRRMRHIADHYRTGSLTGAVEGSPKAGDQEKPLRLQDLRNSHKSWPTKFYTTRSVDLKAKDQPYKQSLAKSCGTEEFLNQDQQYTLDRQLKSHHTQLIALGGLIGTGIFLSPATNSGLLPLLMAITLIGLIAWPFMFCLGELLDLPPMDVENLRIADLNLYQKLQQCMYLFGAAFSITKIMSSGAWIEFLADEELGYVFGLSCITFGVGRYYAPNILKAISSKMSGIHLLIQTFMERCTNSLLGYRSSRSRSHARQALTMSLLLWTTPVTATAPSLSTNTPSPYPSFLLALFIESGKLFSVSPFPPFPFPLSPFPLSPSPLPHPKPTQTN